MIKPLDSKTYAIQIKLGPEVDWLYITKDENSCTRLTPETFTTILDAERFAETWKRQGVDVQIIEYNSY